MKKEKEEFYGVHLSRLPIAGVSIGTPTHPAEYTPIRFTPSKLAPFRKALLISAPSKFAF